MSGIEDEIRAMEQVAGGLEAVDGGARLRILRWAIHRYGGDDALEIATEDDQGRIGYSDFVGLFDAANPTTGVESALVGGYWLQAVEGADDFQSQQVNDALKDLGRGVANITDALAKLERRRPALVRQVAKAGRTRQARKRYRLTTAGLEEVARMLSRLREQDE